MVIVALIGAAAAVMSAWISQRTHQEVRSRNGSPTGSLVDRIADKVIEIDTKVDGLQVQVTELRQRLDQIDGGGE